MNFIFSAASNFFFFGRPCAKPVSEPSLPTTRWQGTWGAYGFLLSALPTARYAFEFSFWAIWL